MKILLTGAGGQIGHDLIGALVAARPRRRLDRSRAAAAEPRARGRRLAAARRHRRRRGPARCSPSVRPELVFHLAAILSARGEQDPRLAYDVNQTGTWNVLEACRRAKVKRLMFTSSIAVFGPPPSGPLPDPTPDDVALHPTTMYGVTKVSGELLCAYYRKRYDIDCRGVRFPGLISRGDAGRRLVGLRAVHVRRRRAQGRLRGVRARRHADPADVHARRRARAARARDGRPRAADAHDLQHRRVLAARRRDRDVGPARDPGREVHATRPIRCARASSTRGRSRSTTPPRAATGAGSRRYDLDGDDRRPASRASAACSSSARSCRIDHSGSRHVHDTRSPSSPQHARRDRSGRAVEARAHDHVAAGRAHHDQRQARSSTSARTTTSGCRATRA